jgi:hypothetical protein
MTKLAIINMALKHLGMNTIDDLDGQDPSTLTMLEYFDTCRNIVFEEHQFSFANAQMALTESAIEVPLGWTFAYDYPTENCAAVWTLFNAATVDQKDAQDFDTYRDPATGDKILVSNLDEAYCEYSLILVDPEDWSEKFAHAVSFNLAASAAPYLGKTGDEVLKILAIYGALISDVKRVDAAHKSKKPKLEEKYLDSRG